MFQFTQNEATASRRRIFFYAVSPTDGYTAVTSGLSTSTSVLIVKNGVTPGTSVVSPTFTHISNGLWYHEMTSGNLDTVGVLTVTIVDALIRTVQLIGYVYSGDPLTALPTFPANFSSLAITGGGAVTAGTVSDKTGYSLSTSQSFNTTGSVGSVTGNVAGSVNSVTSAVTVGTLNASTITATSIAADAITAAKIADSAITIRLSTDGTASEGRIVAGTVASDTWNALLADYTTANTFGARIVRTRSTSPSNEVTITGSFHIAADVHELQPAVITAADFSANAIDANALATSAVTEIAAGTWTYDISSISISGQAGRYLTDTAINASNTATSVSTIESVAYRQSIADYLLGRNIAGGSDGGRTVKDAFRALRNKSEIVGTTLTVYQENDTTSAWTATVSSSASADPVTGIDPA